MGGSAIIHAAGILKKAIRAAAASACNASREDINARCGDHAVGPNGIVALTELAAGKSSSEGTLLEQADAPIPTARTPLM